MNFSAAALFLELANVTVWWSDDPADGPLAGPPGMAVTPHAAYSFSSVSAVFIPCTTLLKYGPSSRKSRRPWAAKIRNCPIFLPGSV